MKETHESGASSAGDLLVSLSKGFLASTPERCHRTCAERAWVAALLRARERLRSTHPVASTAASSSSILDSRSRSFARHGRDASYQAAGSPLPLAGQLQAIISCVPESEPYAVRSRSSPPTASLPTTIVELRKPSWLVASAMRLCTIPRTKRLKSKRPSSWLRSCNEADVYHREPQYNEGHH